MATPYGHTKDGFETQFGTNHVSHFLLFHLLKPTLLKSSTPRFNSRVVTVSSNGHRLSEIRFDDFNFAQESDYVPFVGYGQSKTANIYMANEIDRRYGKDGLHGLSVHPGGIWTGLQIHVKDPGFRERYSSGPGKNIMKSPEQGAATQVYAAISKDWEGRGGRYLCNCEEAGPSTGKPFDEGYSDWVYDVEKARKLWDVSLKMIGEELVT
jgi:NAD(P)-dependent dehydrogenase (short-subunit alcohol dehydrogenase family)